MIKHNYQAVLFDLDGTLLDTAPDMGLALNIQLAEHGKASIALDKIRPQVSHGAAALLKLGFNITPDDSQFEDYRQQYLKIYRDNIAVKTAPFTGIEQLLNQLESNAIKWGVVTNKPEFLTLPLLDALNLKQRASCIVSGDTIKPTKPHPAPMFLACQQAKIIPQRSIYVGDAARDIQAGKAAGMMTIAAKYGYILETDDILAWQPDLIVDEASQIQNILSL